MGKCSHEKNMWQSHTAKTSVPSRHNIGNMDDTLMLTSLTLIFHRFNIEHPKIVSSMVYQCFQSTFNGGAIDNSSRKDQ